MGWRLVREVVGSIGYVADEFMEGGKDNVDGENGMRSGGIQCGDEDKDRDSWFAFVPSNGWR